MNTKENVDYYKSCPFGINKDYNIGKYIGRYDGWSSDFGSFIFIANGNIKLVHPTDIEFINTIKLI